MKLSDYPLLDTPSANAVIPVVDAGSNWTYPLGNIGGGGGFSVSLSADAGSIALPPFKKNKFYRILAAGKQSGADNIRLLFSDFPNGTQFQNRFIFGSGTSVVTNNDPDYGGLSIGAPASDNPYSYSGTLTTFDLLSIAGTVERIFGGGNTAIAMTLRNGRSNTLLSTVASETLEASIAPIGGVLRAGFTVSITEL